MNLLRNTLYIIAVFQLMLGSIFIFVPAQFAAFMGLAETPEWVNWLFVMMGARFLGFAFGMVIAAREPQKHVTWIGVMIAIQALDWLGTIFYLATGAVTLAQVTTASFVPLIFIAILTRYYPGRRQQQPEATT